MPHLAEIPEFDPRKQNFGPEVIEIEGERLNVPKVGLLGKSPERRVGYPTENSKKFPSIENVAV